MTNNVTNTSEAGKSTDGLAHLCEPVAQTEPVSFEMESLQRLLSAETLYHGDLSTLIYGIADLGKLSEEWKAVFEQAYEKIPLNKRIYARDAMLYLYCAFEDYEAAARLLPATPYTTFEITTAMRILSRLKRFSEAEAVAQICRERLSAAKGGEDELPLRRAMERFFVVTGKWDEAFAVWTSAKLSDSVNPYSHLIEVHALQALTHVREGLRVIAEFQNQERAKHKLTRGQLSFTEQKKVLKRREKMLRKLVSPVELELLTERKTLPVIDPRGRRCPPRVQIGDLIMSLETEQRERFGQENPIGADPGEN